MPLLTDFLNNMLGSNGTAATPSGNLADDFSQIAHRIPPDVLSKGLSAAFGSNETPAAGQMVSQMFNASSPEQRAGMLNQLISALGPAASSVLGGALGSANVATPTLTPDQASSVSPSQVQDAVAQAQQHNPGILETLSGFYAQHPVLVQSLGSAALAITLGKVSEHMKSTT